MSEKRARASALAVDPAASPSDGPVEHETAEQAQIEQGAVEHADLYARLATPFDVTFRDLRGGVELEYITGEQCVTRLNETLGVANWSFRVLEHGIHAEADECWVLGELTATIGDKTVTRQQFGAGKDSRHGSQGERRGERRPAEGRAVGGKPQHRREAPLRLRQDPQGSCHQAPGAPRRRQPWPDH